MTPATPSNTSSNRTTSSGDGAVAAGRDITGPVNISIVTQDSATVTPSPARVPQQLPSPMSERKFVGRAEERRKLKRILKAAQGGKVALTALGGMGGVGKTELAVFVANQIKDQFPDGQLFIKLYGTVLAMPVTQVMSNLIRTLQPDNDRVPDDPDAIQAAYLNALSNKRVLLLLDDARDAEQVRQLLPPLGCGLIVTARHSLASLSDKLDLLPVGLLTEEESVQLLRSLVWKHGTDDELKVIANLCGYLPLALNVAGSFLVGHPERTPTEYIAALEQHRLRSLKSSDDTAKNVETVLALSASQLAADDPELAVRWQLLSVFPGDFDETAATSVMDLSTDTIRAKECLSKFIERSLVLFDTMNRRYRLHDLMRDVAARIFSYPENHPLGTSSQQRLEAALRRHATHYLPLLSAVNDGLMTNDRQHQRASLTQLQPEAVNIMALTRWLSTSLPQGDQEDPLVVESAFELVSLLDGTLRHLLDLSDLPEEVRGMVETSEMADGYWMLAEFQSKLGDLESAIKYGERALDILEVHHSPTANEVRSTIAQWKTQPPVSNPLNALVDQVIRTLLVKHHTQSPPQTTESS